MLTRAELFKKAGYKPDPYCKIQALEWLVDNLNKGKFVHSFDDICQIWDWQKSKVVGFLDKLKSREIIVWESDDGLDVKINFAEGMDVSLQEVWH